MGEQRLPGNVDAGNDAIKSDGRQSQSDPADGSAAIRKTWSPIRTNSRPGRGASWCVPTRLVAVRGPLANLTTVNELFADNTTISFAAPDELAGITELINHEFTNVREPAALHHNWLVGKRGGKTVMGVVVDEIPEYSVLCFVELHAAPTMAGRRAYTDFARRVELLANRMKYKVFAAAQNNNKNHKRYLKALGMKPYATLYQWENK